MEPQIIFPAYGVRLICATVCRYTGHLGRSPGVKNSGRGCRNSPHPFPPFPCLFGHVIGQTLPYFHYTYHCSDMVQLSWRHVPDQPYELASAAPVLPAAVYMGTKPTQLSELTCLFSKKCNDF
jgi:hypothetical protein